MKVIALMENEGYEGLVAEHGLSIYIEYRDKKYLLDTGASNAFVENAGKLGVDLAAVDIAALSHAHYDHSGGYEGFFEKNQKAKVFIRREVDEDCYSKVGPIKKYIGVPHGIMTKYEARFVRVSGDYRVEEGVWLIPHKTENIAEKGKKGHMYCKTVSGYVPDEFRHEQSLVFDTEYGLVIFNSCCHSGVENIVAEVLETFEGKQVAAVFGGFHLMGLTGVTSMGVKAKEVEALGEKLIAQGVEKIYTCHCTGKPAYAILERVLGERVQYFSAGMTVEL